MKVFGNTVDGDVLVPGSVVGGEGRSERGTGPETGPERERKRFLSNSILQRLYNVKS